jgi:hypothetical protein
MTRGSWVYRNGELVEKGGPLDIRLQHPRSDLPCPMLVSDAMPAAEHVDGRFYESKSAFRRVTKEQGFIEVGNDPARFNKPKKPDRDKAIDASIERAIARVG